MGDADMMAKLSHEPFEPWHGPGSECRQADGADARAASMARFAFVMVLSDVEMEVAP